MRLAISVFAGILGVVEMVGIIVLFYLSIKKCFGKSEKRKLRLFLATFFTNPLICYLILFAILFVLGMLLLSVLGIWSAAQFQDIYTHDITFNIVTFFFLAALFLALQILIALKMAKWLHARYPSLVVFLYLMFSVFMVLSMRMSINADKSAHPVFELLLSLATDIILAFGIVLFYFLVVKPLAELTERPFDTNWRIFVIPPAAFCFLYAGLAMGTAQFLDNSTIQLISFFSNIVMFLFIWAFCIIIKNINATGDALEARDEVKTLSVEVMEALAHTIDAKDEYTRGHSVRVAKYSRMLAERMGLSPKECEDVYYMGLLHDIGKIGVPNEIINSPNKLTDEEYAVIKTHPGVGYDILAEIKSRPDLSVGARWHHERFDGEGYPDRKTGEDTPLPARIISVADSYDAMTSNRSYRDYLPQDKVRDELKRCAGTQFDPRVVEAMLSLMDEDPEYKMHE